MSERKKNKPDFVRVTVSLRPDQVDWLKKKDSKSKAIRTAIDTYRRLTFEEN